MVQKLIEPFHIGKGLFEIEDRHFFVEMGDNPESAHRAVQADENPPQFESIQVLQRRDDGPPFTGQIDVSIDIAVPLLAPCLKKYQTFLSAFRPDRLNTGPRPIAHEFPLKLVDEIALADIPVSFQARQVLRKVDVILEFFLLLQEKQRLQALPVTVHVIAGGVPVTSMAALDGDVAQGPGRDVSRRGQGQDEMPILGTEIRFVRNDEEIVVNGIPGIEDAVALGNERRQGVDAQTVRNALEKMFQYCVVGNFELLEIHEFFFSMRIDPGISTKPVFR
jgi:hypothetical protein